MARKSARQAMDAIRFPIAGRVVQRTTPTGMVVDIIGHTVTLVVPWRGNAPDPALMETLDHCCNGDLVRATVRPLPGGNGDWRKLELVSLDIDFAGLSADPLDGPLLWSAADGVETGPNGGKDHGKTEARTTETHEQAEG